MVKCAACGKFMGSKDGVSCPQCRSKSHNECVRIPIGASVADSWRCGECQCNAPKGRDPATPIRSLQDSYSLEPSTEPVSELDMSADVLHTLRREMRSEFTKIQNFIKSEFKTSKEDMSTFLDELRELRREIAETRSTLHTLNNRMDEFDTRLLALELVRDNACKCEEVGSLEQALNEMKLQLNDREQECLLNDVEITGLPEEKGENPGHIITVLGTKLGVVVDERDIVMAEREGGPRRTQDIPSTPIRPRRLVVRFARRSIRDEYLHAARVRRGLTCADIGIQSAPVRIFVNERLTKPNRQLFAKAREECRRRIWKYCWTKEGRIYARKEHGASYSRIRSENDLTRFFVSGHV